MRREEIERPNPGSDEAVRSGCRCPVYDNARGNGFPYGGKICHWISADCPLHGAALHPLPGGETEEPS